MCRWGSAAPINWRSSLTVLGGQVRVVADNDQNRRPTFSEFRVSWPGPHGDVLRSPQTASEALVQPRSTWLLLYEETDLARALYFAMEDGLVDFRMKGGTKKRLREWWKKTKRRVACGHELNVADA